MTTSNYSERLWPSPWLYLALLLLVPGVMLLLMPINSTLGMILAPVIYVLVGGLVTLSSPKLEVTEAHFSAGRATIPTEFLGRAVVLDREDLQATLGPKADARAYSVVRGWVHQGVKVENLDSSDPAPYWLVTTRFPERLCAALGSPVE